ncbi:Nuclear pore complex protein Nup88 [Holothuria leucospilota]|uniref:Nuclear pore complex protein Nup88 n=1 Tax=Holothuria leucospilota TaxID=206669 RepID=A0A9Q1CGL1_HOLLE|nr:Nuclear pore complex protein Nup88 [Holothuria leucospilota]
MAASMENVSEWRLLLNSLKIFDKFRKRHEFSEGTEPKNLLAIREGRLYVWDGESRLLTTNLHDFLSSDMTSAETDSLGDLTLFQTNLPEQSLLCTDTPFFKVEHISFNTTGQQVLLWGKQGASVLFLPHRQGKHGSFQGGKGRINCRTIPVAERFFSTNPSVHLLQASWHPGSDSASHVVFLTSDNIIRIYDTSNAAKAMQVTKLGNEGPSYSLSPSHTTFEVALGDIAVAFDFGVPLEVPSNNSTDLVYPLYILKGNGDVFMLLTSLQNRRYQQARLQGPLVMHPPAEDNYGLDACSILCLHSTPPVLVVATSAGFLHHCVLLNSYEDEVAGSASFRMSSAVSLYSDKDNTRAASLEGSTSHSLYVYESLELSLTPVLSENEDLDSDISYPIMLVKDDQSEHCFYCCHGAGLHSISLPWLEKMERFCNIGEPETLEESEETEGASELQHDQPCVVQHLVCTKPSESCPPAPVLGLSPLVDPLLGSMMVCLSSEGECFVTPLVSEKKGSPISLASEKPSEEVISPLRQLMRKPFQQQIKEILQRDVSNPILKTSTKTELTLEESFKLLQRATHILREEYILKQDQAREEIEKRVKILEQQKQQQLADLADCRRMESQIRDHVSELAEMYEDAQDKQEELLQRVGVVLHTLQNQLPILSEAEQGMRTDLMEMEGKLTNLETALSQVKKKFGYHKRGSVKSPSPSPGLSQSQQTQLKTLLKEENDKISELIAEVKNLTTVVAP